MTSQNAPGLGPNQCRRLPVSVANPRRPASRRWGGRTAYPVPRGPISDLAGYASWRSAYLSRTCTSTRRSPPTRTTPATPDLAGAIAAWYDLRGQPDRGGLRRPGPARRARLPCQRGDRRPRAHRCLTRAGHNPSQSVAGRQGRTGGNGRHRDRRRGQLPGHRFWLGRENRAALRDAIDAGADTVGGAPWLDPDPAEALRPPARHRRGGRPAGRPACRRDHGPGRR